MPFVPAVRFITPSGGLLERLGKSTSVGDEGGFAPCLRDTEEALTVICEAVTLAGYDLDRIKIALDLAASEWWSDGKYLLPKSGKAMFSGDIIERIAALTESFPIISVEDGLGEDDIEGWCDMTDSLGGKILLVGDDLFVTSSKRVKKLAPIGCGNAVLIKPNQIGTLSETLEVIRAAVGFGYERIISHRSGETCDTYVADIAVGTNSGFIKAGAPCRGERTAKYNRLLEIEKELGDMADFGNNISLSYCKPS